MERGEIDLSLSGEEAEALARAIYLIGEHISAGAPIPQEDHDFNELVGAIYQRLLDQLRRRK